MVVAVADTGLMNPTQATVFSRETDSQEARDFALQLDRQLTALTTFSMEDVLKATKAGPDALQKMADTAEARATGAGATITSATIASSTQPDALPSRGQPNNQGRPSPNTPRGRQ
jgi:hypothetical protein